MIIDPNAEFELKDEDILALVSGVFLTCVKTSHAIRPDLFYHPKFQISMAKCLLLCFCKVSAVCN